MQTSLPVIDSVRHGRATAIVAAVVRRARVVVAALLVLTLAAGWFVATHFAMSADTGALLAADLPFRVHERAFDTAFPQTTDLTVVVVDGASPETVDRAAATLARRLASEPKLFRTIRRPDAGAYFDRFGLLLLPLPSFRRPPTGWSRRSRCSGRSPPIRRCAAS